MALPTYRNGQICWPARQPQEGCNAQQLHHWTRPCRSQNVLDAPAPAPEPAGGKPVAFGLAYGFHMAYFAFAAYLEPNNNRVYAAKKPNGVKTQFCSRRFVQQNFEAVVTVTVVSAEGLPRSDVRVAPSLTWQQVCSNVGYAVPYVQLADVRHVTASQDAQAGFRCCVAWLLYIYTSRCADYRRINPIRRDPSGPCSR
jgi:hypothetical protein